jgi:hypothetical protein
MLLIAIETRPTLQVKEPLKGLPPSLLSSILTSVTETFSVSPLLTDSMAVPSLCLAASEDAMSLKRMSANFSKGPRLCSKVSLQPTGRPRASKTTTHIGAPERSDMKVFILANSGLRRRVSLRIRAVGVCGRRVDRSEILFRNVTSSCSINTTICRHCTGKSFTLVI